MSALTDRIGTFFIGERRTERLTCSDTHLPSCYNPHVDLTACICGRAWWVGDVGVWHSVPRRSPAAALPLLGVGIGAPGLREPETEFLGWDTYFLHADQCPRRRAETACVPCCGGATPTDYATAANIAGGGER